MTNDLLALRKSALIFRDTTTNNTISVQLTKNYLSLTINNRSYYFDIEDGKYDGYSDATDITVMDKELPSQIEAIFS